MISTHSFTVALELLVYTECMRTTLVRTKFNMAAFTPTSVGVCTKNISKLYILIKFRYNVLLISQCKF